MLSINIPVYNIEVGGLVESLKNQGEKLNCAFEINVYDDGSLQSFKEQNRSLLASENVNYFEQKVNLGRAAIRNRMAEKSKYKWLLFIDGDSEIISEQYLKYFLNEATENRVLCGGTAYEKEKPKEPEKMLRWFYGSNREATSANDRNNKKGFILTSNNFLIEKEVFLKIGFREDIRKYGHEDTLLGFELFKKGVEIFHINNPVVHTGLENSTVFLEKTKTALDSLYFISNDLLKNNAEFNSQVYFLNKYQQIRSVFPVSILAFLYKLLASKLEQNLLSQQPKLRFFDLYKILYYSTIKKPHPKQ